jgi:cyclic pyranopterin phosphate synthase
MSEHMVFLPKKDLLSLEELGQVCDAFIARGVTKIRLSGGEPLVRKDFMTLVHHLSTYLDSGQLKELTLTTNATQLTRFAKPLKDAGVKRLNVSLDTLDPLMFNRITRGGNVTRVLEGIDAALEAGLKIKINTVVLKNENADILPDMIDWAHKKNIDMSLIEVMPMGETGENRLDQYIPLLEIRDQLEKRWTLTDTDFTTGGPSRYVDIEETGGRLGFISPLSHNFCATCNRVRVTCTGKLYMCLGQNENADLRASLRREHGAPTLNQTLDAAIGRKPEKHNFEITEDNNDAELPRHMSVTGG